MYENILYTIDKWMFHITNVSMGTQMKKVKK